jgi:hypothetical protein
MGRHAAAQTDFEAPQYPQYVQYPQGAPPVVPAVVGAPVTLTPTQMDQLLGPIALYPDPLLALIFPASTYPQDIISAQQWLASTPNPTESAIDAQGWDESVKGLVHYPTVLKMMNDQIEWTEALGAAFINQQADVLASVQRLRGLAKAAGNLQTNQQQQLVEDGDALRIEPVDPDVVYVPQYDPNEVYIGASPIVWGSGYPIGLWCDDDFDWGQAYIVVGGGWYRSWHHPAAWDQHPPAWYRPNGWLDRPAPWKRVANRPAPPRLTSTVVSHLKLDVPRIGDGHPAVVKPGAVRVGGEVAVPESKNVFGDPARGDDVQREEQRAKPVPVQPHEAPVPERTAPAPERAVPVPERAAPVPQRAAPAPPPREAPAPPPRPAPPASVFGGGAGGAARAQSQRGNASIGRK